MTLFVKALEYQSIILSRQNRYCFENVLCIQSNLSVCGDHGLHFQKESIKRLIMVKQKIIKILLISLFLILLHIVYGNLVLASGNYIRPNKNIRLGGYFYGCWKGMGGDMSREQISWAGNHLDILSAVSTVSKESLLAMRKINPNMHFYIMTFATTLYENMAKGSGWPVFDHKNMNGWVVRLKNGEEAIGIRRTSINSGVHIMDLSSLEWANYFRSYYSRLVKERQANGIAIDEIMWNGYWGIRIPEMAKYNSAAEIRETCHEWLKTVTLSHEFEVIHQAFWNNSEELIKDAWSPLGDEFTEASWGDAQRYTDGIWGEHAFHAEDNDNYFRAVYYRKMNWEQILRNLEDVSRRAKTYIWAAWYDRGNREQLEYCLSTYLIAKGGNSAVFQPQPRYGGGYPSNLGGYDIQTVREEYETNRSLFDLELGEPIEDAIKIDNNGKYYWRRKFKEGLVVCNPSLNDRISIHIGEKMFDINDKTIQTIVLKPRTGAVMTYKSNRQRGK